MWRKTAIGVIWYGMHMYVVMAVLAGNACTIEESGTRVV